MFIVLFMLIPDNKSDVAHQIVDKITLRYFINKGGLIPLEWVWHKGQEEEQGGHGHAHRVYHHGVTLDQLFRNWIWQTSPDYLLFQDTHLLALVHRREQKNCMNQCSNGHWIWFQTLLCCSTDSWQQLFHHDPMWTLGNNHRVWKEVNCEDTQNYCRLSSEIEELSAMMQNKMC